MDAICGGFSHLPEIGGLINLEQNIGRNSLFGSLLIGSSPSQRYCSWFEWCNLLELYR
jgi:hypothetical protein